MTGLTEAEKKFANELVAGLSTAKVWLSALAGSPVTAMGEKLFPQLVGLVAKLGLVGTGLGVAAEAIPLLEEAITVLSVAGFHGADQDSLVWQRQEEQNKTGG